MAWDTWVTVFQDDTADMSCYDYYGVSGLQVQQNVIYFGSTDFYRAGNQIFFPESYLRPKLPKSLDFDITVKLQIIRTLKTNGTDEDVSHWFGIALRTVQIGYKDAYLFYIRKNGEIEFGLRDVYTKLPPPIPDVATQAVTVRVKVDGDNVQTWVNGKRYHNWKDEEREFIRKGYVDLVAYAALVQIYSVEIKIKKWYAPLDRFWKRLSPFVKAMVYILGLAATFATLYLFFHR